MKLIHRRSFVNMAANIRNTLNLQTFNSVSQAIDELRPEHPVYCIFPDRVKARAAEFTAAFPGEVLYAVKSNDTPLVIQSLWEGGVRHFDVASLYEVALIKEMLPEATLHLMNPVKSEELIAKSYFDYGVRTFSLDCQNELHKIMKVTGNADDLDLFVRTAVPSNYHSANSKIVKFGASEDDAVSLVQEISGMGLPVGIAYLVGTQCLDPGNYNRAIQTVANIIEQS